MPKDRNSLQKNIEEKFRTRIFKEKHLDINLIRNRLETQLDEVQEDFKNKVKSWKKEIKMLKNKGNLTPLQEMLKKELILLSREIRVLKQALHETNIDTLKILVQYLAEIETKRHDLYKGIHKSEHETIEKHPKDNLIKNIFREHLDLLKIVSNNNLDVVYDILKVVALDYGKKDIKDLDVKKVVTVVKEVISYPKNKLDNYLINNSYKGDIIRALFAILRGADINVKGSFGDYVPPTIGTPLLFFAGKGYLNMVKWLLKHGANVHALGEENRSVLHLAAENKNCSPELIKILVQHGVPVNIEDKHGNTPLHYAVLAGNVKVVDTLISLGADINANGPVFHDILSPLDLAADRKKPQIVKLLLERKANLDTHTFYTPLFFAIRSGCLECAKIIIKYIYYDSFLRRSLVKIIEKNSLENIDVYNTFKYVLEQIKNLNVPVYSKSDFIYAHNNLLHFALKNKNLKAIKLLLELGADPNYEEEYSWGSPMYIATVMWPCIECVKLLVKEDLTDHDLTMALRFVVYRKDKELAEEILEKLSKKLDLSNLSNRLSEIMSIAIVNNMLDVAKELSKLGIKADSEMLFDVIRMDNDKIDKSKTLSLLLEYGADPNERHRMEYDKYGPIMGTALEYAAKRSDFESVRILRKYGAK